MGIEQKCENCRHYEDWQCFRNAIEIDVSPLDWCFNHHIDWDKVRREKEKEARE